MEFNINIKVAPEDIAAIGKVIMSDTDDTENQDFDSLRDCLIKSFKESVGNNDNKDKVEIELDAVDKDKDSNSLPRDVEAQAMANAINYVLKRHGFTRDILDSSNDDNGKSRKATFIDLDNDNTVRFDGYATFKDSDDDDDDKK